MKVYAVVDQHGHVWAVYCARHLKHVTYQDQRRVRHLMTREARQGEVCMLCETKDKEGR